MNRLSHGTVMLFPEPGLVQYGRTKPHTNKQAILSEEGGVHKSLNAEAPEPAVRGGPALQAPYRHVRSMQRWCYATMRRLV